MSKFKVGYNAELPEDPTLRRKKRNIKRVMMVYCDTPEQAEEHVKSRASHGWEHKVLWVREIPMVDFVRGYNE